MASVTTYGWGPTKPKQQRARLAAREIALEIFRSKAEATFQAAMAEYERKRAELASLRSQIDAYDAEVGASKVKEAPREYAEATGTPPTATEPARPVYPSPLIENDISGRHLPDDHILQRMAARRECRVEWRSGLFCIRAWTRWPEYVLGIYVRGFRSDSDDESAIRELTEAGWTIIVEDASHALNDSQHDDFLQSWEWPIQRLEMAFVQIYREKKRRFSPES
jgi:hypothetical protein